MDIDTRLPSFQQAVDIQQHVSEEIILDARVSDQKVIGRRITDRKGNDRERNGDTAIDLDNLVVGILNDLPSHLEGREVQKAQAAIQA